MSEITEAIEKAIVSFEVNTLDSSWAQYQPTCPTVDGKDIRATHLKVTAGSVRIEQYEQGPPRYKIFIDDVEVKRVRRLELEMLPGELPLCRLEVYG